MEQIPVEHGQQYVNASRACGICRTYVNRVIVGSYCPEPLAVVLLHKDVVQLPRDHPHDCRPGAVAMEMVGG